MQVRLTYSQYCYNRMARQNASFVTDSGVALYQLDGEFLSQKEMDERYPIKGKLISQKDFNNMKGNDIDSTKNWKQ